MLVVVDDVFSDGGQPSPEQRLWGEVLKQAVEDLRRKEHREDAIKWLLSNRDAPCSFRWVCFELGLNPEAFKRLAGLGGPQQERA